MQPKPNANCKKRNTPPTQTQRPMTTQAGLVPPPKARRFMIFNQRHRQNHADRPEGTRPLKTAIFPAPRHTIEEAFADAFPAISGRNGVSGCQPAWPFFEAEPKPGCGFSRKSRPTGLLFKNVIYRK